MAAQAARDEELLQAMTQQLCEENSDSASSDSYATRLAPQKLVDEGNKFESFAEVLKSHGGKVAELQQQVALLFVRDGQLVQRLLTRAGEVTRLGEEADKLRRAEEGRDSALWREVKRLRTEAETLRRAKEAGDQRQREAKRLRDLRNSSGLSKEVSAEIWAEKEVRAMDIEKRSSVAQQLRRKGCKWEEMSWVQKLDALLEVLGTESPMASRATSDSSTV